MAARESIGTILSASAASLASQSASDYGALSYDPVGEVTEVPEYGPESATVEHTPLATGITEKFHGAINYGSLDVPIAWDESDAGQDILRDAFASRLAVAISVEYPSGDIDYFQAKVMSLRAGASVGNVRQGTVRLEITTAVVTVAA